MSQTGTGRANGSADRIALSEGELRLRVRGCGPAVLCLHGLSAHGGVWDPVVARLEDRWTLYVPDLLGRGASDPNPDVGYGLEEETSRVRALLASAGVEPLVTVGHSQGAAVALSLATSSGPETGLVLVCPVTPWTRRPAVLELLRWAPVRRAAAPLLARMRRPLTRWILRTRVYGDPSRADRETAARYAAPYADARRARSLLRALADWRPECMEDRLPAGAVAARVLAGGRDRRIRPREARRLARRLGGRYELVPEAGHLVPEEAPDRVARAVDAVYAEVRNAHDEPEE